MKAAMSGLLSIVVLCACVGAAVAQEANVDALQKELAETQEAYNKASRQLSAIRGRLYQADEVREAREAADAAARVAGEAQKNHADFVAARKAEAAAAKALSEVVAAKLAADPKGRELAEQAAALETKERSLNYEKAITETKLNSRHAPHYQQISTDPAIVKLYEAARSASKEDRTKAWEAHRAAVQKAQRQIPAAAELLAQIEQLTQGIIQAAAGRGEIRSAVSALRRSLDRGEDPDIVAARAKRSEANKGIQAVNRTDEMKAILAPSTATRKVLTERVDELVAANADAAALLLQRNELRRKMGELQGKIRAAAK